MSKENKNNLVMDKTTTNHINADSNYHLTDEDLPEYPEIFLKMEDMYGRGK